MGLRRILDQLARGPANDARQILGDRGYANIDPLGNSLFPVDKSILNPGPKPEVQAAAAPAAPPAPDPVQTLIRPTEMPSENSASAGQAKRLALRKQLARRGRMSTILTQPDDSLGA